MHPISHPKPARSRRAALTRVALYLMCIAAVSGVWLAQQARADVRQRLLAFGRELDMTVAPRVHPGTTELVVNGAEAALDSRVVSEPIDSVLDRFETLCARASGGAQEELLQAQARSHKLPVGQTFGVFRTEHGQKQASAACIARKRAGGLRAFVADAQLALASGDLAELGQVNYVFARVAHDQKSTHVISVWSRGTLNLVQMFPSAGDAPGSDLAANARPLHATRVFSTETRHHELSAILYETQDAPDSALTSYATALEQVGYSTVVSPSALRALPVAARIYRKDGHDVYLLAERHEGKTLVLGVRPNGNGYVRAAL